MAESFRNNRVIHEFWLAFRKEFNPLIYKTSFYLIQLLFTTIGFSMSNFTNDKYHTNINMKECFRLKGSIIPPPPKSFDSF